MCLSLCGLLNYCCLSFAVWGLDRHANTINVFKIDKWLAAFVVGIAVSFVKIYVKANKNSQTCMQLYKLSRIQLSECELRNKVT